MVDALVAETSDPAARMRTVARRRDSHRLVVGRLMVFAIGVTSCVPLANVTVTGLSLVCLALAPGWLLIEHRAAELVPVVLGVLGWISYCVACLVGGVGTMYPNALAPAAFSLYLVGLIVVAGRSVEAIADVLAGIAAGTVLFHLLRGIELSRTGSFLDLWKYGIAQSVTILVLWLTIVTKIRRSTAPLLLVALGCASLVLNFRSHALVCLAAAAVVFAGRALGSRVGRAGQLLVVIAAAGIFAVVMPIVARTGMLGSALKAKILEQDANGLPILFAGRPEPPLSLTAILERPLVGWGSAQQLPPEVYTAAQHLAIRVGFAPTVPFDLYWRIPGDYSVMHSLVLGSWAEGGIVAMLLPLWLLGACGLLVWRHPQFGPWAVLVVFVAVQGVWDLLFSPWTYNLIPVYACVALFAAVPVAPEPAVAPAVSLPVPRPSDAKQGPNVRIPAEVVGVVIPTVGRSSLDRAVQSALGQTRPPDEIVVVADTDAPLSLPQHDSIVVIRAGPHAGPARCRQIGIDAGRGTIVALLDDDDEWHPDKLRRQLDAVAHRTDGLWVVSSRTVVAGTGGRRRVWPRRLVAPDQPVAEYLFRFTGPTAGGALLQASTLCFPADLARRVRWDADPQSVHDEPGWLMRVQRAVPDVQVVQLPDVLSTYHVSAGSLSRCTEDRTAAYIAWGLDHLRGESSRVLGDYLCTSPVAAAVAARSLSGVWQAVRTALHHGRPGPQALAYAAANAVRIGVLRMHAHARSRWTR